MMLFVALVVLRLLLRREVLVGVAAVGIWTLVRERGDAGGPWLEVLSASVTAASAALVVVAAIRFGLLSLVVGYLVYSLVLSFPIRPDLSVWYSTTTRLPTVALVLLVGGAVLLPRDRLLPRL